MELDLKLATNKQLVDELNDITNFMEYGSIGKRDIMHENAVWKEIEKRDLELNKKVTFTLPEIDEDEEEETKSHCDNCGAVIEWA